MSTPTQTIGITGASGFIGTHLIPKLVQAGHQIHALVRSEKKGEVFKNLPIQVFLGDVSEPLSLEKAFAETNEVIHLVAIIAETGNLTFEEVIIRGTERVVNACLKKGVKRIIYLSGLGVEPNAVIRHFRAKWKAEQLIQQSGLEYIILRPSFILGLGDEFTMNLVRQIKSGEIRVYGDGNYKLQPLLIDDFIALLLKVVITPEITNRIFELGGPVPVTYNQLIDTVSEVIGIPAKKKYLPLEEAKDFSPDELYILTHDYTCDSSIIANTYQVKLTSLPETLRKIIEGIPKST